MLDPEEMRGVEGDDDDDDDLPQLEDADLQAKMGAMKVTEAKDGKVTLDGDQYHEVTITNSSHFWLDFILKYFYLSDA